MKCSAACSAVLRHPPSPWTGIIHWSTLRLKALRSSTKHPIHSFSCPSTQSAPPTRSPNITHFGSLVSSIRWRGCAFANRCNESRTYGGLGAACRSVCWTCPDTGRGQSCFDDCSRSLGLKDFTRSCGDNQITIHFGVVQGCHKTRSPNPLLCLIYACNNNWVLKPSTTSAYLPSHHMFLALRHPQSSVTTKTYIK